MCSMDRGDDYCNEGRRKGEDVKLGGYSFRRGRIIASKRLGWSDEFHGTGIYSMRAVPPIHRSTCVGW